MQLYCRGKGKDENGCVLVEAVKGGGGGQLSNNKGGTSNAAHKGIRSVGGGLVV